MAEGDGCTEKVLFVKALVAQAADVTCGIGSTSLSPDGAAEEADGSFAQGLADSSQNSPFSYAVAIVKAAGRALPVGGNSLYSDGASAILLTAGAEAEAPFINTAEDAIGKVGQNIGLRREECSVDDD